MMRKKISALTPPPDLDPELLKKFDEDSDEEEYDDQKEEVSNSSVLMPFAVPKKFIIGGICFACTLFLLYIVAI